MESVKVSYLYLNIYLHPKLGYLLYAGSCTRKDNKPGQLNPHYHGSSSLIKQYHWEKFLIKELFICNTTQPLKDESTLIDWLLTTYGSLKLLRDRSYWVQQYPEGLCVNGHNNTLSHAIEKLRLEGPTMSQRLQMLYARDKALKSSKTSLARLSNIKKANKACSSNQRIYNLSKVDREIQVNHRVNAGYIESSIKGQMTRLEKGIKSIRRIVECNGITGSVEHVCSLLGNKNWNVQVSRKLAKGVTEVTHHGYTFTLLK